MPEPTFQNLGFELAGTVPGLAEGWALAFLSSAEEIAGYGPAPERPSEDFERAWFGNETFLFGLPQSSIEPALYDEAPESVEDFDEGWQQNETFFRELASIVAADYEPGPGMQLIEAFEARWAGNEDFLTELAPGNLAATPLEAFASGWRGNESFSFAFSGGDVVAGPNETFETGWTPMTTV